jgi:hypothetical protein
MILKHTHIHKCNAEQNNIFQNNQIIKEYNESWNSDIYSSSQVQ